MNNIITENCSNIKDITRSKNKNENVRFLNKQKKKYELTHGTYTCAYDCHSFIGLPVPTICEYDSTSETYTIEELCCSVSCAVSLMHTKNDFLHQILLPQFYIMLQKVFGIDITKINPALPRNVLKIFSLTEDGMTIEEFREKNTYYYDVIHKLPFVTQSLYIERHYNNNITNSEQTSKTTTTTSLYEEVVKKKKRKNTNNEIQ